MRQIHLKLFGEFTQIVIHCTREVLSHSLLLIISMIKELLCCYV